MSSDSEPQDWESEALLPARLLAGTPPAVQAAARRMERCLYLWILERLEPESGAPALGQEVAALVGELATLVDGLRELDGPRPVIQGLEVAVSEACTLLDLHSPASQGRGVRHFALQLSGDSLFRDTLQAFGGLLGAVRREPGRDKQLAALYRDLLWIRAVLQQHIARRGEISSLQQGDSVLCAIAGMLASRLEAPIATFQVALQVPPETPVEATA